MEENKTTTLWRNFLENFSDFLQLWLKILFLKINPETYFKNAPNTLLKRPLIIYYRFQDFSKIRVKDFVLFCPPIYIYIL